MPIFLARPSKSLGLAWLCPAQSWRSRLLLLTPALCYFVVQTRRCWYQLAWLGCAKSPPARTSSLVLHGADAAVQVPASLAWLCRDSCCSHQLSGFLVVCYADAAVQVSSSIAWLCQDLCFSHQPQGVLWRRRAARGGFRLCPPLRSALR